MTATNSIEVASGSNTVSVLTVNGLLTMNAGELELGFNPSDQSPHSTQATLAIGPQGHVTFASSWVYGGYGDVPPGITNQVHIDLATGGQLTSDTSYGGFGMRLWSEWTDTTGDGKTWTLNGTDDGGAGTPSFEGVLRTLYAAGLLTRNGGQSGFFDYDFIYTPGLTGTSGTLEARDITSPDVHVFMGYVSSDFLDPANWLSEGTPTPGAMAAGDTYFVAAAATLQGAASLEGTLEVLDGITLTVGTSGALTVTDATVSGPGSLAVNGLLSVEGTNNMSCSLTLESTNASGRVLQIGNGGRLNNSRIVHHVAGEALINGYWEHGQSPLLVEANATLSGTGYIKGPVTVYGTLHPGPEVGTGQLTIQGQYYCSIDSTTRIRVNGSGTSSFDRILVYGGAGVSGTLLVDFTGKPYADPGTYVFLTSSFPEFAYTTRTPVGLDASRTFGYDIATNGQFTITSAGTPYEDWTTIHELSGTNADFTADPDGDGGLNGYEWATGSDPTNALSLVPLTMLVESNSPSLHFTRNTNATDVTIYVQQSTNLLNSAGWTGLATNAAGTWTPPGAVIESGPTSPRDVQIGLSATNAPASYYRLHITRP